MTAMSSPNSPQVALPASRPTGFDILRIMAAAVVIIDHSFLLRGSEPVWLGYSDYGFTPGRLAVIVFFAVSGYLVTGSWLNRPSVGTFVAKRLRRIYPALTVMVIASVLIVGPIETVAHGYFRNRQTALFAIRNLLILPYDYHLPGVFQHNPTPAINGVLWTLGVEVIAYISVIVIGKLGLLHRPWVMFSLAAACLVASWPHVAPHSLSAVSARLGLLAAFYLAAGYRVLSTRRPPWQLAVLFLLAAIVGSAVNAPVSLLAVPAFATLTVLLGLTALPGTGIVARLGDPSYGMYIYGFVIQQLLVAHSIATGTDAGFIAVSLAVSAAVGYLSWHVLEKRVVAAPAGFFLGRRPTRAVPIA